MVQNNLAINWPEAHMQICPLFYINLQRAPMKAHRVQDQLMDVNTMQAEQTDFNDISIAIHISSMR